MSARGATRDREIAVRSALGASSTRLLRQMLTESVLLAALGGGLGLLVAYAAVRGVVLYGPPTLPRIHEINVDRAALAFTAFVTMATGIVFGLVPARQSRTKDVARVVRGAGHAGPPGGSRLRSVLVVAELALSLALLVGAVLLVRSFVKLDRVDLGFIQDHAVTVPITLSRAAYRERGAQRAFVDRLLERVRALPGVAAAGVAAARAPRRPALDFRLYRRASSAGRVRHSDPAQRAVAGLPAGDRRAHRLGPRLHGRRSTARGDDRARQRGARPEVLPRSGSDRAAAELRSARRHVALAHDRRRRRRLPGGARRHRGAPDDLRADRAEHRPDVHTGHADADTRGGARSDRPRDSARSGSRPARCPPCSRWRRR